MQAGPLSIPEVLLIEPRIFRDRRGFFLETYQRERYAAAGIPGDFVQDNLSGSHRGVLRGLHYQVRQVQGKLVHAAAGEIFDAVVDLRKSSPTFGKWTGALLSAENQRQLWVPPGFAHGFYVLSEWAEVVYKCTDLYAPQFERTLIWNDPEIGIQWPLVGNEPPILAEKDENGLRLADAEVYA